MKMTKKVSPGFITTSVYPTISGDTTIKMEDGSLVPIKQVQVGNRVPSYDVRKREGEVTEITSITSVGVSDLVVVHLEGGSNIRCTHNFMFGCKCGAKIPAFSMHWRRVLSSKDEAPIVVDMDFYEGLDEPEPMYNITLKNGYAFYVTDLEVVVNSL